MALVIPTTTSTAAMATKAHSHDNVDDDESPSPVLSSPFPVPVSSVVVVLESGDEVVVVVGGRGTLYESPGDMTGETTSVQNVWNSWTKVK